MQFVAAHSYMGVSDRVGNSSKILPLQPIAVHSYMVILVRGLSNSSESFYWSPTLHGSLSHGGGGVIPQNTAHSSPLLHGKFSQGVSSSKVLKLQPKAAHSYRAILVR